MPMVSDYPSRREPDSVWGTSRIRYSAGEHMWRVPPISATLFTWRQHRSVTHTTIVSRLERRQRSMQRKPMVKPLFCVPRSAQTLDSTFCSAIMSKKPVMAASALD